MVMTATANFGFAVQKDAAKDSVWRDRSEICLGLIFEKMLDHNMVNANDFISPYDQVVVSIKKGATLEDIIARHGFSIYQTAVLAAQAVIGNGGEDAKRQPIDWVHLLEQAASYYRYGQELARMADRLMQGQEIDPGQLLQFASGLELGQRVLTPLSEVKPENAQWIKTGWEPLDKYVGGLPKAGLTIIAGGPGIGKTTAALQIAVQLVRLYDGRENNIEKGTKYAQEPYSKVPADRRKVAIFSLEMLLAQVAARFFNVEANLTKDELSRILGTDSAYTVGEVYAVAARAAASENLAAIIIDFADLLVEGEQNEAVMGVIYRSLAVLAKTTGVPVILICQLRRTEGGIPRINHIRYSGMAEMMASLVLLFYNPSATVADISNNGSLPYVPGVGYAIVGKSRFGFAMGGPGAIQLEFKGEKGWGDEALGYLPVTA